MDMVRVRVACCLVCGRKWNTDESVDDALGTNYAQYLDLNIHLPSVDVDDVAPPTLKLSGAKHHASLLSSFLLEHSLYFGVNEINSFQKL